MFPYLFLMTLLAARELISRLVRRDWTAVRARLGRMPSKGDVDRTWLHAASNGELTSARPVIDRLITGGHHLLITVNTDSALQLAQGWSLRNTEVTLAPVDLPGPTRRVIKTHRIRAHITLESDLWPLRILNTPGPVLVLGARLTERSAKGWARFPHLSRRVLSRVSYLSAQDEGSASRFLHLGLAPAAKGPVFDLKALYTPPTDTPNADLTRAFARHDTWLAASTHDGEEGLILAAHKSALARRPTLRLILAPRHPIRADAVASLITSAGLTYARRSTGDDPAGAQVYLADTFAEMHLWYTLAGVTFVAGSLTDRGGHTPYEPAAFGSAILHGPDTNNFRAAYQRLSDANAAIRVTNSDELAQALIDRDSPEKQTRLGAAAQSALHQETDIEGVMQDVLAALDA